jgi:DNA-binding protein HU-beta
MIRKSLRDSCFGFYGLRGGIIAVRHDFPARLRLTSGGALAIKLDLSTTHIPNTKVRLMNKGELIDAVAAAADLTKTDATKAVEAFVDTVTRALKKGDQVSIVGFGSFVVKARAARQGRNPKTGEAITIAASNVPGFKAGKALKDAVN